MIATITKLGGFARTYGHARLYYMVLIALGTLMGSGFIVKWFAGRAKRRGCTAPVIPTASLPQQLGTSDRQEEKSQLTEDVPLFIQDLNRRLKQSSKHSTCHFHTNYPCRKQYQYHCSEGFGSGRCNSMRRGSRFTSGLEKGIHPLCRQGSKSHRSTISWYDRAMDDVR